MVQLLQFELVSRFLIPFSFLSRYNRGFAQAGHSNENIVKKQRCCAE